MTAPTFTLRFPGAPVPAADIVWPPDGPWEHMSAQHGIDYDDRGRPYWRADGPPAREEEACEA